MPEARAGKLAALAFFGGAALAGAYTALGTAAAGYGELILEGENPPRLQTLVCGTFYAYDERNGSYIYNVNMETGDIVPLLSVEGFQIQGCCLDENERYILVHGYYFDSGSGAVIVMEVGVDNANYHTEAIFEERFEVGSVVTSVYDERETCFYIGVAKPGRLGAPIEGSYEAYYDKTGKTGDTVVCKYKPGSTEMDLIATLPYYLKLEAVAHDPERLHVFYEEYPYAKRLGYFNTRDGSVAFLYPWPDYRFAFFDDPDAFSKDCPKNPVSYFCIPAFNGHAGNMIVFMHYSTGYGEQSIMKIGDAILLPVLFSESREELVYLTYDDGETVLRNYLLKESTRGNAVRLPREMGTVFKLLYAK